MEKNKKALVLRIVALFILSNLASLMIGTYLAEPVSINLEADSEVSRPDYSEIKISLEVNVDLRPKTPYTLVSKDNTLYIPYVFFVSNKQGPLDSFEGLALDQGSKQEIVLSVPKRYIATLLQNTSLKLLPQLPKDLVTTKSKRRSYEISY